MDAKRVLDDRLMVRLPASVREQLEQRARAEERTTAQEIRLAIRRHLEQSEKEEEADATIR